MSSIILYSAIFLIGEYRSTPTAAEEFHTSSYKLLYTKPNILPLASPSQKEKTVVKGMLVTEASSYSEINQIAEEIKGQYASQKVDAIELSIHNKNNGKYEEDLPYEPISKGTISITYSSPSDSNITVHVNTHP